MAVPNGGSSGGGSGGSGGGGIVPGNQCPIYGRPSMSGG